ncbi:MAG: phosphopantetheine-binding protein [Ignavibacteriales bacterium]|nr:phosphopantetheine-binding protein [Ignavibacteriales bacterium]
MQLQDIDSPVRQTGLDSLDLVVVRVTLEKDFGLEIPDGDWFGFDSIGEAIQYCEQMGSHREISQHIDQPPSLARKYSINMPQMAISGLSENWLFKELGDIHWDLLFRGLGKCSSEVVDEDGNRLYATFARIQFCSASLSAYKENDEITIDAAIRRFGKGTFVSEAALKNTRIALEARLMTCFASREMTDNTKLLKCQPSEQIRGIPEYATTPEFLNEYRLIKKGLSDQIDIAGHSFRVGDDYIYEREYTLNPYYDLNGVGLLYFASYPVIADFCESKYFNGGHGSSRWETDYSTSCRDVHYFANCNIEDSIIFRLNSHDSVADGKVKSASSLYRKSDMTLMARIFTVKDREQGRHQTNEH